jgi:hypothetical protein
MRPTLFRILDFIVIFAELLSIYMLRRYKNAEALFLDICARSHRDAVSRLVDERKF